MALRGGNVSVVMPCRNVEAYIDRALTCIRQQSHEPVEIIVLDDGSTDGTSEIIKRHADADQRIQIIRNGTPKGLTWCLTEGITHARGEWIARMDGDDLCSPVRLERQLGYLEIYPDARVLGCLCYYIDDQDQVIGKMALDTFTLADYEKKRRKGKLLFIAGGASLIHKATLLEVDGFSQEYELIEDLELNMRIAQRGYLVLNVPEYLYMYRKRESSNTGNTFVTNRKMRWVKEISRCRDAHAFPPSYGEYQEYERQLPIYRRFSLLREDLCSYYFRRFGVEHIKKNNVRSFFFLLAASMLGPIYVGRKMAPTLKTAFGRSVNRGGKGGALE